VLKPRHPALSQMRSSVPGIEWPPVAAGAAAPLAALVQQLDQSQWLSRAAIEERQFRQLAILARHAAQCSDGFKARLEEAGLTAADLATPDGLAKLPVLSRRRVQQLGDRLYCSRTPKAHGAIGTTTTSGSTGEPVVVRRTGISQLDWMAMTLREHLWHARDFGGRLAAIRANIDSYVEQDDWGHPASLLFRTGPSIAMPITADVRQHIAWLTRFGPDNLLVYPNALAAITRHVRDHAIRIPSLRHLRTIGETLSPNIRAEAAATFGAKVADIYSSQEMGCIALECPDHSGYHTMAEALIVEVLDEAGRPCGVGETGRVTITDLHNFATPLVRYDIGDYAEVGLPCECGRGLPTLSRILGRERNLIAMPDGTRHWPLVGFAEFRAIAPVGQYQFIQHERDRIEVRLVVERPLTSAEETALRAHMQRALGHPFQLDFNYFEGALPKGAGGKFEEFVCRVAPG